MAVAVSVVAVEAVAVADAGAAVATGVAGSLAAGAGLLARAISPCSAAMSSVAWWAVFLFATRCQAHAHC